MTMKILLIDDNERLSQIYLTILSSQGHSIEIELDCTKAFERTKTVRPDVVLLDIMMEPVSGWEVLELIRSDSDVGDIPVIILTGKIMSIEEAAKYGLMIDGFVMKPLERSMLVNVIDETAEILLECQNRYSRALASGLSEEQAAGCRHMIRKRKMIKYLKDLLSRQERILSLRSDEQNELTQTITQLRLMVESLYQDFAQKEALCP